MVHSGWLALLKHPGHRGRKRDRQTNRDLSARYSALRPSVAPFISPRVVFVPACASVARGPHSLLVAQPQRSRSYRAKLQQQTIRATWAQPNYHDVLTRPQGTPTTPLRKVNQQPAIRNAGGVRALDGTIPKIYEFSRWFINHVLRIPSIRKL